MNEVSRRLLRANKSSSTRSYIVSKTAWRLWLEQVPVTLQHNLRV
jgi:hypothetical protein